MIVATKIDRGGIGLKEQGKAIGYSSRCGGYSEQQAGAQNPKYASQGAFIAAEENFPRHQGTADRTRAIGLRRVHRHRSESRAGMGCGGRRGFVG